MDKEQEKKKAIDALIQMVVDFKTKESMTEKEIKKEALNIVGQALACGYFYFSKK